MSTTTTRQKCIVIVGPTSGGKSDLAVQIAKKFGGEIISADSRQVYRHMNLGTGKITKKEMKGIPHHMLDVANPWTTYSVSKYQTQAKKIIKGIISRGHIPIICGGTGLYIDALMDGLIIPEVKPNRVLRKELEKKTTSELFLCLERLDPERARDIDQKNPRRLIRAIEIAYALGRVPKKEYNPLPYETLWIGTYKTPEELRERIIARLHARMRKGIKKEIQLLHKGSLGKSVSWKKLEEFGLEYRYVSRFLQSLITHEELMEQLSKEIYAYAKRQMTWFKRNKRIHWITKESEAFTLIQTFLK